MLEIEKEINFKGSFFKAYEGDDNPIDNFSATVGFYKNGQVFLKAEHEIFEKILKKMERDTEHYVEYPTYNGEYQIKGTTSQGRELSAITRYNLIYSDQISLKDVTIGNTLKLNKANIIEAHYCLANCPILLKTSTPFLNYQDGLILTPNGRIFDSKNQNARISIMILKNPNGMPEEEYKNYSTWFELILSFASGHNVEEIYSIKIFKVGNSTQELEYWSGEGYSYSKASGIKVIERLDEFICKVSSAVNYENFDQKGLGTALGWYVDCFNTTFAPTTFIILCTILETLSEKCLAFFKGEYTESEQIKKAIFEALEQEDIKEMLDVIEEEKQSFKRKTLQKDDEFRQKIKDALKTSIEKHLSHSQKQILIENEYYNKIKDKFIDIFNQTKDKMNDEKITKYDICKQKIEQAFKGEFDNFNKPTFAYKINCMLNRYKVIYENLFEGIDSLKFLQELNSVRNDLIHRGYTPIEKLRNYSVKLKILVVRILLCIVEYEGDYWELKKVEFSNPPQYDIYERRLILSQKKMTVQEETIAKIRKLPEPLVQQVNDYIEFLLMKNDSKRAALWMQFNEALEIAESDFADYLPNLEDYEERLARGEIQW